MHMEQSQKPGTISMAGKGGSRGSDVDSVNRLLVSLWPHDIIEKSGKRAHLKLLPELLRPFLNRYQFVLEAIYSYFYLDYRLYHYRLALLQDQRYDDPREEIRTSLQSRCPRVASLLSFWILWKSDNQLILLILIFFGGPNGILG